MSDDVEQGDRDDDLDDLDATAEALVAGQPSLAGRTLVIVLAAGAGSRYSGDTHKLDAVIGERTVAEHSIIAAIASGVGNVVVITGATQPSDDLMSALARSTGSSHDSAPGTDTVEFIHHPDWADGQASSLQVALAAAGRTDVDAVVVGLADQPGVLPEAWQRVAASLSPIAVATYDDQRGNPVRLHRSVWDLLPTEGDEGARSVMRLRPDLVEQVHCPGSAHDIDTREDLQLWQSKSSTSSP